MIDVIFCILFCLTAISQVMLWRAIENVRMDNDLLSRRISTAHDRLAIAEQQWEKLANERL